MKKVYSIYSLRDYREALEGNPASVPLRLAVNHVEERPLSHRSLKVIRFNSETTLGLFGVMNTQSEPEASEREQPRKQARRTCEVKLII